MGWQVAIYKAFEGWFANPLYSAYIGTMEEMAPDGTMYVVDATDVMACSITPYLVATATATHPIQTYLKPNCKLRI